LRVIAGSAGRQSGKVTRNFSFEELSVLGHFQPLSIHPGERLLSGVNRTFDQLEIREIEGQLSAKSSRQYDAKHALSARFRYKF